MSTISSTINAELVTKAATSAAAASAAVLTNIFGIDDPVICGYFTTLNQGKFISTAALFSKQGCLNPPFEKPVQGRTAIAQYLAGEAGGMSFLPERGERLSGDHPHPLYYIQGKVKMPWFTVNVTWLIQLNAAQEIIIVDIKLLASLNDLLAFNRG